MHTTTNNAQSILFTQLIVMDMLQRILHNNAVLIHSTQQAALAMLQPIKLSSAH